MRLHLLLSFASAESARSVFAEVLPLLAARHRFSGTVVAPGPLSFPAIPGVTVQEAPPSRGERLRALLGAREADLCLLHRWPDPVRGLRFDGDDYDGERGGVLARARDGLRTRAASTARLWPSDPSRGPLFPITAAGPRRSRRPEALRRILSLGRREPEHGPHLVIEAVAGLLDRARTAIRLDVVGPPGELAYERSLERRARDAPVHFTGTSSASRWLEEADLVVLPSPSVGRWGRVALEARAAGVPVLHGHSPILDAIVGEGGRAVHAGDVRVLAATLKTWIQDPAAWDAVAAAAWAAPPPSPWQGLMEAWDVTLSGCAP